MYIASVASARYLLRSAASRTAATAKLTPGTRARPTRSSFRIPKPNTVSNRIFRVRSPVEMSSCVDSMLPYHTATASALLTSMLSVSRRSYGWTPEGNLVQILNFSFLTCFTRNHGDVTIHYDAFIKDSLKWVVIICSLALGLGGLAM